MEVTSGIPSAVLTVINQGGLKILADSVGSTASGGSSLTTYTFLWGDDTFDLVTCAATTLNCSPSRPHTYLAAGTYTVTLRVTDDVNRTGIVTKLITLP